MLKILPLFALTLAMFAVIDGLFINFVALRWYREYLPHLISGTFSIAPAVLFYLVYISGLLYFVIMPALASGTPVSDVFVRGFLLGLFAYATYDLTNQVLLRDWPWFITLTDIAWGALVTGTVASAVVAVMKN